MSQSVQNSVLAEQPKHTEFGFFNTFSMCVCFKGHFPGGPGLASTRMSPFWI